MSCPPSPPPFCRFYGQFAASSPAWSVRLDIPLDRDRVPTVVGGNDQNDGDAERPSIGDGNGARLSLTAVAVIEHRLIRLPERSEVARQPGVVLCRDERCADALPWQDGDRKLQWVRGGDLASHA